jgi:hypothetical protein
MSDPKGRRSRQRPANDNVAPRKPLRAVVLIPQSLPIQPIEVEVFAELLDSLGDPPANDNDEGIS